MNTEEFIRAARKVHGNRYDYSKSVITNPTAVFIEMAEEKYGDLFNYSKAIYVNENTPVTIIDRYGEFEITPKKFLAGKFKHLV